MQRGRQTVGGDWPGQEGKNSELNLLSSLDFCQFEVLKLTFISRDHFAPCVVQSDHRLAFLTADFLPGIRCVQTE